MYALSILLSIVALYSPLRLSSLAVFPPEECELLHQLQVNWSQPIRDAIVQLFEYVQQVCDSGYRKDSHLQYTIDFGECPNVDEYCDEYDPSHNPKSH